MAKFTPATWLGGAWNCLDVEGVCVGMPGQAKLNCCSEHLQHAPKTLLGLRQRGGIRGARSGGGGSQVCPGLSRDARRLRGPSLVDSPVGVRRRVLAAVGAVWGELPQRERGGCCAGCWDSMHRGCPPSGLRGVAEPGLRSHSGAKAVGFNLVALHAST